jgi:hypothetical protein
VNEVVLSRKLVVLLHVAVVFVSLLVVVGLKVMTVPKEPPREALGVTTDYPFMLTITTQKDNYRSYEPVNMQITLKNIGDETVTIMFMTRENPSKLWFQFVYDESGGAVFYWKWALTPTVVYMTLQPNESMEVNCTWDQKNTDTGIQVPLGYYYLTASVSFQYNASFIYRESQKRIIIPTC